jgi:enediyne biosynthesis protein E4
MTLEVLLTALLAAPPPPAEVPPALFTDVTEEAGITFVHYEGATGDKLLPETMGGGVAFFDYDGDGDPDLLLVDSGSWPAEGEEESAARPLAVLYSNESEPTKIRFRDVTEETGLAEILASPASPSYGSPSYGQGVAVGDYDGDGRPDLYLTAAGPNRLLRNRATDDGGARFEDVTEEAGTSPEVAGTSGALSGEGAWSTGAAFFDADGDGDLDLFVANYLEWSPALDRSEETIAERTVAFADDSKALTYGRPQSYRGAQPFLFVNDGEGGFTERGFTERARAAGLHVSGPNGPLAKALAVAPADVDGDGRTDLLVANDTTRNLFFHNRSETGGSPRFEEAGELFGLAYDADGRATGAMGVDWGSLGGSTRDGGLVFLLGNFADEATSLYRAQGDPTFWADESRAAGLAASTREALTFGVLLIDQDLDGRLELLQTNGHVEPDIERVDPRQRYLQPAQLFRSVPKSSRWIQVPAEATGDLATPIAGRGAAYADVDGDGDLDLALTRIGGPPLLLRNDQMSANHWLRLRLVGEPPNRDAIGARVAVTAGGRTQTRDVQPARGYLSAVELPLTFGLGSAKTVETIEVTWPGGATEVFEVEGVDRLHELKRGAGKVP